MMTGKRARWLWLLLGLLGLSGCGGDVSGVKILSAESELYSQQEIESAVDVIVREFDREWSGCTLREIGYAGDEASRAEQKKAVEHGGDEALVLTSTFDVDDSGGDGSLNPNSSYSGWQWILVRGHGGTWRHVDHGYG